MYLLTVVACLLTILCFKLLHARWWCNVPRMQVLVHWLKSWFEYFIFVWGARFRLSGPLALFCLCFGQRESGERHNECQRTRGLLLAAWQSLESLRGVYSVNRPTHVQCVTGPSNYTHRAVMRSQEGCMCTPCFICSDWAAWTLQWAFEGIKVV